MKKILDLGCGYGDIGGGLFKLGADVSCVDVRPEHLRIVNKKFAGIKTFRANLNNQWPFVGKKFDIIVDLGTICHLNDFAAHLKLICSAAPQIILETAVCDSDDPNKVIIVKENQQTYDLSFNGSGCRPSSAAIEKVLTECGMNFKILNNVSLNTNQYRYNWTPDNDDSTDFSKRRMWVAVKNNNAMQFIKPDRPQFNQTRPFPPIKPAPSILSIPTLPLPPSTTIQAPIKNNSFMSRQNKNGKIRLFYNYYEDKNPERKKEIDLCLQKNINCAAFDIIILNHEQRPTFNFFFEKINLLAGLNDISIICNADIFFDNTISFASKIEDNEILALNRYNWTNNQSNFDKNDNQNCWIVKGKVENVIGNFQIGLPKSNNRIAYEFNRAGYKLLNQSKDIKTYHVHNSNIKNYTEQDIIIGSYLSVPVE